ncbi:flagellar hook-associated protein FlgK [Bacillus sp. DJP31]|uniref:flagellar hook-associated protein FlgK n=1 Tax=Bacillus sp. DJP31 TaxID=3409789 RepID=UPI003BB7CB6B
MRSTFQGLETARRGMVAQQSALYVTGHNISNANTPGYTRQRVDFKQTEPYPAASMNSPMIPGQMGTGVEAGSIERIRESFLDKQYRNENAKTGYWSSRSEALEKMEEIMNEPSDSGLSITLDRFWQSLQDLSTQPEDPGARSVVLERGRAVAETFNFLSNSLSAIQGDFKDQINVTVGQVNSLSDQINNVNKQISEIEPHGYVPNDLYDERDRLIDELSGLVDIKVTRLTSGGKPSSSAEGILKVELVDKSGNSIGDLVKANELAGKPGIIDGISMGSVPLAIQGTNYDTGTGLVKSITLGTNTIDINSFNTNGKLRSLIDSFGYMDTATTESGLYPKMLDELDLLAKSFGEAFTTQHKAGFDLSGVPGGGFFSFGNGTEINAKNMIIDPTLTKEKIAAAATKKPGDSGNALLLADVKDNLTINGVPTSINAYYEGVIGDMAVNSQEANRLSNNSGVLRDSVEQRRQSVSAVSIDEEMTNMIKFQHAYNASARNITIIDEMLDKIINGLGTGGR